MLVLTASFLAGAVAAFAETITWTGGDATDNRDWFRADNWDLKRLPAEGDDVRLSTESNVKWDILLTNSTPHLKSFEMYHKNPSTTPEYRVYLNFKNWSTKLWADDIHIKQGGMIRTVGPFSNAEMSNRVWIAGVNLTFDYYSGNWTGSNYKYPTWIKDGCIYVSLQGYKSGYGPGWATGKSSGGGYGGTYGGGQSFSSAGYTAPKPYGDAAYPYDPGCGAAKSSAYSHAGGAVFLDLTGALTVNGAILAEGSEVNGDGGGGGSGGGVMINCKTITGKGSILANGHFGNSFGLSYGRCAGSGGRIAVHYDPVEQAKVMSDFKLEISAHGGGGGGMTPITRAVNGNGLAANRSEPGTLWFPDLQLLQQNPLKLAGVLANVTPNAEVNFASDLTVSGLLGFAVPVKVSVGGDLNLSGTASHALGFWFDDSAKVTVGGNATVKGAMVNFRNGGSFTVGGDLTLTNASSSTWYTGGELSVCGGASGEAGKAGMEVTVGGTLALAGKSVIWPKAHTTSGSVAHFTVKNAEFKAGSAVDGIGYGYAVKTGPGYESSSKAATHAGEGAVTNGSVAKVYGDRRRPTLPGSGSSSYPGGGVFWMDVKRTLTANGDIAVIGGQSYSGNPMSGCNGGSGGSLFIMTRTLIGSTGVLSAEGGHGDGQNGSWGAGGGRVAIWCDEYQTNGTFKVTAAGGRSIKNGADRPEGPGGDGTVYLRGLPGGLGILLR